jgi:hypothetical protein
MALLEREAEVYSASSFVINEDLGLLSSVHATRASSRQKTGRERQT